MIKIVKFYLTSTKESMINSLTIKMIKTLS